jgi:hypothetical protein
VNADKSDSIAAVMLPVAISGLAVLLMMDGVHTRAYGAAMVPVMSGIFEWFAGPSS